MTLYDLLNTMDYSEKTECWIYNNKRYNVEELLKNKSDEAKKLLTKKVTYWSIIDDEEIEAVF